MAILKLTRSAIFVANDGITPTSGRPTKYRRYFGPEVTSTIDQCTYVLYLYVKNRHAKPTELDLARMAPRKRAGGSASVVAFQCSSKRPTNARERRHSQTVQQGTLAELPRRRRLHFSLPSSGTGENHGALAAWAVLPAEFYVSPNMGFLGFLN